MTANYLKGDKSVGKIRSQNRLKAIRLYSKRALLWNSVLPNYLTGDFFSSICDYVYQPPAFRFIDRGVKNVSQARTIFCPSHMLEDFLAEHGSELTAEILVLGNSDRNFDSIEFDLPPTVKRVYAQNLQVSDQTWKLLPIGLENMRLGRNVKVSLRFIENAPKHDAVLCGPFSNTHSERRDLSLLDFSTFPSLFVDDYIEVASYRKLIAEFRFILCPRGNGVDTHRFWEVVYAGGIPIVKESPWSNLVSGEGVHLLCVNDWTEAEICRVIEENSVSKQVNSDFPFLTKQYWKSSLGNF